MIVVNLIGRLGNQMFQYAFAKQVSKHLQTSFLLNPIYKNELTKYFVLDNFTSFLNTDIGKKINSYLIVSNDLNVIEQNGWQDSIEIKNDVIYNGFFQSQTFFKDKSFLIKPFTIKKKYVDLFQNKYSSLLKNKYLVIHIRRTDYIDYGNDNLGGKNLCLPLSYYSNCLKIIENIDQYQIICISDDIDFAKNNLQCESQIYFEVNDTIIDFQLMLNADIVIIANSSFAWWASYLNPNPNKIILAPKYWLGFKKNIEYPVGVTNSEFKTIDVY